MLISVELSFYPFADDFKAPVREVIAKLSTYPGLDVQANRMSTQIFGEFEDVTRALNDTMVWSFEEFGHCVFVAKYMQGDRRPLRANT